MAANDERKAGVMSDKNGNVYKMRDYELLEQSEAQTIGNTDYFVLEDVNGGYHKILKSSVMGVIREALGELVNSRDKATGAKSALVLDNNNDLGTSSISAFAQMLGVINQGLLLGSPQAWYDDNDPIFDAPPVGVSFLVSNSQVVFSVTRFDIPSFQIQNYIGRLRARVRWGGGWSGWKEL